MSQKKNKSLFTNVVTENYNFLKPGAGPRFQAVQVLGRELGSFNHFLGSIQVLKGIPLYHLDGFRRGAMIRKSDHWFVYSFEILSSMSTISELSPKSAIQIRFLDIF